MNRGEGTLPSLDASAPPWDYNPSAWRYRVPICVLAAVAFLISAYMALYQWRLVGEVWDPVFGDQSKDVLDSTYRSECSDGSVSRTRRWARSLIWAT